MLQMVCLAVTCNENIHPTATIIFFFHSNYFHTKLFKSDLASRPTKIELIPGLANSDIPPFMSIKLGSVYESTHVTT